MAKMYVEKGNSIRLRVILTNKAIVGPTVAMGYWNDEKATNETFSPGGWLRTGDRFRVDETGTF